MLEVLKRLSSINVYLNLIHTLIKSKPICPEKMAIYKISTQEKAAAH
jgi:hypothetical protein